jgi:RNA polymerase-binding protein DksA
MLNKDLEKFKKKLEKLKAEILKIIHSHEQDESSPDHSIDEVDQASELMEKMMGFATSSSFRANMKMVDEALKRIELGEYGKCKNCGNEISIKRLEVLPFTQFCIECQKEFEQQN